MSEITKNIGEPAVYENLAEECLELGKAALKMARILRAENPSRTSKEEAMKEIIEELADVLVCASALDLYIDMSIMAKKNT